MIALALSLTLALVQEPQDTRRIPADSIELTVTGCLKGRILTTLPRREADVQRGPDVGERRFRVAAKGEVMDEIKKRNNHLVEVVGLVKRSALDDTGVKSGPVTITGGPPVAGSGRLPTGAENVAVMDVSAVRMRASSCRGN
jgi:hypothetical protein